MVTSVEFHRRGDALFHFCSKAGIQHFQIDFEIEAQRAGIEIAGTDIGPLSVDGHQFGMVERASRPPDPAAVGQDLVELGRHGVIHEMQIVAGRDDDIDLTPRRAAVTSALTSSRSGQEIGRHDADMFLRNRKCAHQHLVVCFQAAIRAGGYDPHKCRFRDFLYGCECQGIHLLAGCEMPVLGGNGMQIGDGRAGDPEMGVLAGAWPGEFGVKASRMFMPPVKVRTLSMMMILRWVRRLA